MTEHPSLFGCFKPIFCLKFEPAPGIFFQEFLVGGRCLIKVLLVIIRFRYEKGGERVFLTPERSMQVQEDLGADIIMVFDECVEYPATYERARAAMERTLRWETRCQKAHTRTDQALFAIVQGSTYEDLRRECARKLVDMDSSQKLDSTLFSSQFGKL